MRQPRVTAKQVEKAAKKLGFVFKRHGRGSHDIWQHGINGKILVISQHSGDTIRPGTMNEILKILGLPSEQFLDLV